jgi:hypothetical protein
MDAYAAVKTSKLKLKGETSKSKHKKSKKRKSEDSKVDLKLEDELNHAGGWLIENLKQVVGTIFIEFKEYMYMHALGSILVMTH